MLECFHITEYKLVFISLLPEIILTNNDIPSSPEKTKEIEDVLYCEALGSLM